eukprot:6199524-Pleurochrysis_carterae.AAC.2
MSSEDKLSTGERRSGRSGREGGKEPGSAVLAVESGGTIGSAHPADPRLRGTHAKPRACEPRRSQVGLQEGGSR